MTISQKTTISSEKWAEKRIKGETHKLYQGNKWKFRTHKLYQCNGGSSEPPKPHHSSPLGAPPPIHTPYKSQETVSVLSYNQEDAMKH